MSVHGQLLGPWVTQWPAVITINLVLGSARRPSWKVQRFFKVYIYLHVLNAILKIYHILRNTKDYRMDNLFVFTVVYCAIVYDNLTRSTLT